MSDSDMLLPCPRRENTRDSRETTDRVESQVDHPKHYQSDRFEVIDIIEDFELGFNLGNVVKCALRAGKKQSTKQDLEKAKWYIEREIKNIREKHV